MLTQSIAPSAVILWIAENDFGKLPDSVKNLTANGLEIRTCADYKSFKKLIPARLEHPEAYIAVADDDVYYDRNWLSVLVESCDPKRREIIGHRAHRITLGSDGLPQKYLSWMSETNETVASDLIFLTGVGGVLYPPHVLDNRFSDIELARNLCPTTDDLWFHFMGRLGRVPFRRVGNNRAPRSWSGSQDVSLMSRNVEGGGNDDQLANLIRHFGFERYS